MVRSLSVLATTLAFVVTMTPGLFSPVSAGLLSDQEKRSEVVQVIVKVNEKGFFDQKGRLLGPKNPLRLTTGKKVKMRFVFDEAVNSLAIGDVHQMAITADDGWTMESEKIWVFNQTAALTFVPGENGQKKYRVYCIIDCIGMDHLNNLVINVVG